MTDFDAMELDVARKAASKFHRAWREDLYNAALLAIWQKRDKWNHQRSTQRNFLFYIAYYACVDEIRLLGGRVGSHHNRHQDDYEFDDSRSHSRYMQPEHEIVDLDGNLSHLSTKWSPVQRYVVQALIDGHTKEQVAEKLGVTPSRISQILRPIKQQLAA